MQSWTLHHINGVRLKLIEHTERRVKRTRSADANARYLQVQGLRRRFHFLCLTSVRRQLGLIQHGHAPRRRKSLLEQLEPFAAELHVDGGQPGRIAAGPGKARRKAHTDWVRNDREHDRDGSRQFRHHSRTGQGRGKDDLRFELNELTGKRLVSIELPLGVPHVDRQILALDPAHFGKGIEEGLAIRDGRFRCTCRQESDMGADGLRADAWRNEQSSYDCQKQPAYAQPQWEPPAKTQVIQVYDWSPARERRQGKRRLMIHTGI